MLNIQIDDPNLEADLKDTYGEDTDSLVIAFADFVRSKRVKQDIAASETEFELGQFASASDVFSRIRAKYS